MTDREDKVKNALTDFLTQHSLQESIGSIDDIVLSYVISILEDIGDPTSDDENIDVDQFVEVMGAYLPGFDDISTVEVCEWMFSLSTLLSTENSSRSEQNFTGSENTTVLPSLVPPTVCKPRRESERTVSTSSYDSTSDDRGTDDSEFASSVDEEFEVKIRMLLEMFPAACRIEVEHCLGLSTGDSDEAAQLILHRQDTGEFITMPTTEVHRKKIKSCGVPVGDKDVKKQVLSKYGFLEEDAEKREHKPLAPKWEKKKMVRYLDNKVVSTKGEKFTDIGKKDDEEMKKTFFNLKPARKYRFH